MKTKYKLALLLIIPIISSCIEIENSITFSGNISKEITYQGMNYADITSDGKYIIGATLTNARLQNGTLIWKSDAATGSFIKSYYPSNYFREDFWYFESMDLSKDGKYVAASGIFEYMGKTKYLIVWDIESGKEVFSINPDKVYTSIKWSPDRKKIFLMAQKGRFEIVEFLSDNFNYYKKDSIIYTGDDYHDHNRFYLSPNADFIYFDSPSFINLKIKPYTIHTFLGSYGALFPQTDKMLVLRTNEIGVYNTNDLNQISNFEDVYVDDNLIPVFSPDGKYFVTSYNYRPDGQSMEIGLQIFSAIDGRLITRVSGFQGIYEIKFIDNSRFMVVQSGKISIYNFNE